MSYGIMAYSVDLDKLKNILDSGDDKTRRMISGRFRSQISSINDQLGYSNERGEPSLFEAIRHLIMGGEKSLDGCLYGYGLELLCEHFGTILDNGPFCPCPASYLESDVDSELQQIGSTLRTNDLLSYNTPFALPLPDDFPAYGYWSSEEISDNLEIIQKAENKSEQVEAIQQWLEKASSRNEVIVAFYY